MTALGIDDVQAVLRGEATDLPDLEDRPPTVCERLIHAIRSLDACPDAVGPGDLAALVRQALLSVGHERGAELSLTVPLGPGWPTPDQWRATSCVPVHDATSCKVRAEAWKPDWLPHPPILEAVRAVPRGNRRRLVLADPALTELFGERYAHYSCEGQQAAVHAAFFCEPGSTVLAMLPTGSGKSLVFQLASAVHTDRGGTVVVVVPTTSLPSTRSGRSGRSRGRRPGLGLTTSPTSTTSTSRNGSI